MEHKNIRTNEKTFNEFEKLRYDLRFKKGISKTQSEMLGILVNFFKKNKGANNE